MNARVSEWLYQPFESGPRDGTAPVTLGAVASNLNADDATLALLLPALSRHLPETFAEAVSGPAYGTESQEASPEVGSLPVKASVSEWLYQPFESGPRDGTAPVTLGAVASNLNGDDATVALLLPALSRQLPGAVAEPLSGPGIRGRVA